MYVTVFNASDTPVLLDEDGRSVGGGEWATADPDDAVTAAALEAGDLVEVETPDEDVDERYQNPQAMETFKQTKDRNSSNDEPKKSASKTSRKNRE